MTPPSDAVAAATQVDPYPYYADLVARRPLYRDEQLGLWVASSAAAVTGVLTSGRCRVRPPAEPVPAALVGSPAGEIFGRLVRMTDGERQATLKRSIAATLESVDIARVARVSRERAQALIETTAPHVDAPRLTEFAFRFTAEVMASLLGAAPDALATIARATEQFVGGIAPGASAEAVARGHAAARDLLALGRGFFAHDGVAASLAEHAGGSSDAVIANAIGFLSQSYEATTGLIGNSLLALSRHPELRRAVPAVVREVVRHDAPVQNTRRFVAEAGDVSGVEMSAGDAVLVVLAAANRDPAANPDPTAFDVTRADPQVFTFGVGGHACPGAMLATTIATTGVQQLMAAGLDLDRLERVGYRPSPNTRIPLFGTGAT